MPQTYLYPQRAVNEYPANLGSADAELIVTAEDGMDYVVKTVRKHPAIPASEWVCHKLADACGIPTPQFALIELTDGVLGFGSQWDVSKINDRLEWMRILNLSPGPVLLARQLSAIFTFDLFNFNVDRHPGNYFFVSTNRGTAVRAYDFSRALFYNDWPIPDLPMPASSNTVSCYRSLRVGYSFDLMTGKETIRRLSIVSKETVAGWINDMPNDWLDRDMADHFLDWFGDGVPKRLSSLSKGLENGSFL